MSLFWLEITVPPNTPKDKPKEVEIEVEGGLLERIEYRFPPGPLGSVRVAVFYGVKKISPQPEDAWVRGEDETIRDDLYWPLPEDKTKLKVKGWSDAEDYAHTIIVRFHVSKSKIPAGHIGLISGLKQAISRAFGVLSV